MVIFLAGLQGIPPEVLEAAELDGAGPVRKLWSIQLPLLGPAVLVNVLLTIVHGLKLFDVVWVMTQGGPGTATQTLSTLIFQNAFAFNKVGYSNAIALVLTIIALPVAIIQFRAVGIKRSGL
jgi:raffinose/stachyose/melibiose transport system permease protein